MQDFGAGLEGVRVEDPVGDPVEEGSVEEDPGVGEGEIPEGEAEGEEGAQRPKFPGVLDSMTSVWLQRSMWIYGTLLCHDTD